MLLDESGVLQPDVILIFIIYHFSEEVLQRPRPSARDCPVSRVSRLFVPTERLPAVEASGRPRPPGPVGLPHSDPGGRLSARLHQNL